ncbi:hypothetical protein P3L10_011582 [Capsicum annuum]
MGVLLKKLEAQRWSHLFLQGDFQRKFGKSKDSEHSYGEDVKGRCDLVNIASAFDVSQKFSGNPHLLNHRRVLKQEMYSLHQLYFDIVHKIITPRKDRRNVANFLDLTLMELLDTKVQIDLPRLIIQHMQKVLLKDVNGHVIPYKLWLDPIFKDFFMPVQVWSLQTTKDVIGTVNHMELPISIRSAYNPMQQLRNALATKTAELEDVQAELEAAQVAHNFEKLELLAQIASLQAALESERSVNAEIVQKLTHHTPFASFT